MNFGKYKECRDLSEVVSDKVPCLFTEVFVVSFDNICRNLVPIRIIKNLFAYIDIVFIIKKNNIPAFI